MRTIFTLMLLVVGFSFTKAQTLDDYIQYALDNNPGLQSDKSSYKAAYEAVDIKSSLPNPTISGGYFLSPIETRLGPQQARISAGQKIPWLGSLKAAGLQAEYRAKAMETNHSNKINKLVYEVKSTYYQLYALNRSIHYTKQQILQAEMLEKQAQIKSETGQVSFVDVYSFQMFKEELDNKLFGLRELSKALSVSFNLALNRAKEHEIILPDTLELPEPVLHTAESLVHTNPAVESAHLLVQSADYQLKASELSNYPTLTLGFDYAFIGTPENSDMPDARRNAFMPMIGISLPVYTGKNKAKIEESRLIKEQYISSTENIENRLQTNYASALSDYKAALNAYNSAGKLKQKAERSLKLLMIEYQTDGQHYDRVLFMQNKWLDYQINQINALVALKTAQAYIEYLSGNSNY